MMWPHGIKCVRMLMQVCLPGLHITSGFFLRLFTLLEDECNSLDIELAVKKSPEQGHM